LRQLAAAEAARLRTRLGTSDPLAIARLLGVEVRRRRRRSRADADAGIRSEYSTDPPAILVYDRTNASVGIAHELFHHGQCRGLLAPALCALSGEEAEACAHVFAEVLTGRRGAGDVD